MLNVHIYFVIGFKVVVKDVHTYSEIAGIEGIRSVPSLRSKFPPLYHHRMEVHKREKDALEFILFGAHLQSVLKEERLDM